MKYTPDIEKLQHILSQGTYSLVDDFEEEMVKNILKNETTAMIICGCRSLIRNAFYITVTRYGKEANLSQFCTIVLNDYGDGRIICIEASRQSGTEITLIKTARVVSYFLDEYYETIGKRNGEYTYCKPVRYLCDLILDSIMEDDLLHFFEEKNAEKNTHKNTKTTPDKDLVDLSSIFDDTEIIHVRETVIESDLIIDDLSEDNLLDLIDSEPVLLDSDIENPEEYEGI